MAADVLVFFANWQSQACRLLFECTQSDGMKQGVVDYICRMHDHIIKQGFYENVERDPAKQVSVEVACALEGLNDAYALTQASDDDRVKRYRHCICTGLEYLLKLQYTEDGAEKERGGFGLTLENRMQRIDITGHAGSVAAVTTVRNPIRAARGVMTKNAHATLMSQGADDFAAEKGLEIVDLSYFYTQFRWD